MFRNFLFVCLLLVTQFTAVHHSAEHGFEVAAAHAYEHEEHDHAPLLPDHNADHCSLCQFAKQTAVPVAAPALPISLPSVFVACSDHSSTIVVDDVAFDWHSRAPPLFV